MDGKCDVEVLTGQLNSKTANSNNRADTISPVIETGRVLLRFGFQQHVQLIL